MTIIAAVIIFGVLIFVHEFGHFTTAKLFGVKVHEFSIGMGPAIIKKNKGETMYSLRVLPIGGYVKLEGEDFASEDERAFNKCHPIKRIIVLVSGAFMNILAGFLIFTVIMSFAKGIATPAISEVVENSPAQQVGILPGDVITDVNGKKVHIQSDVTFSLYENGLEDAYITVRRAGEVKSFWVTPVEENGRYVIGFYPSVVKPSFGTVLYNAWYNTFFVVRVVIFSLKQLVLGQVSVSQMSGPVGIVGEIGQAARSGLMNVLYFAALIAVNLGVMNLLPLPALDGGRVIFALAELLCGKPVKPEIEGYIHAIGFALLIVLMLAVTYSDIVKLVT